MQISHHFRRLSAPGTDRLAIQLTEGSEACYPLYYFIPSLSKDCRRLIYHCYENGTVQLRWLNLETGENRAISHADSPEADWRPWQAEPGLRGVRDYRSVLNRERGTVLYFEGNRLDSYDLGTEKTESLFWLPPDREPTGQNAASPDGEWLYFIDAPVGSEYNKPCQGARVVAYHFSSGSQRVLFEVDAPIHHVMPFGNHHVVVNHPAGKCGMMFASLDGSGYSLLRDGDPGAEGQVCHQLSTQHGLAYETFYHPAGAVTGLYDPFERKRLEFCLPTHFGYTHTGWDPEGRLWFWEQCNVPRKRMGAGVATGSHLEGHTMTYLEQVVPGEQAVLKPLLGHWPVESPGQRPHFHPQLLPGGEWILFTAGDEHFRPQIFLLDVADLRSLDPLDRSLLHSDGLNDLHTPALLKT